MDIDYDKSNTVISIKKMPIVDETKLRGAIKGLEDVISKWVG